jgi:hypothetical protein
MLISLPDGRRARVLFPEDLQKWRSIDPPYGSGWPCYRLPDARLVEISRFIPGRDGRPVDGAAVALLLVGQEVYWTLRRAVFPCEEIAIPPPVSR